jgi:methylmalonyl-CoA/ethylmalonyl-CoA epimerase
VEDLDAARDVFERLLGMTVVEEEEVADQGVRVVKLDAGGGELELLGATRDDSPVAKHLTRRGPGLHHVTVRVEDLSRTLRELEDAGVELIDREPRDGAGGSRIAFLHPRSCAGVLVELIERA